jgi:hypothetical protein
MVTRVNALADSFYARYSERLYYNDMSLPYGGVFDEGDTTWAGPHDEHRTGRDMDLRTHGAIGAGGLDDARKRLIRLVWGRLGGTVHPETTVVANAHYHLRYRGPE